MADDRVGGGDIVDPLLNASERRLCRRQRVEDVAAGAAEDDPAQEDITGTTDQPEARLRAVLRSQAQRMARRIEKAGGIDDNEIRVISEAMGVDVARVESWVSAHPLLPSGERLVEELEQL